MLPLARKRHSISYVFAFLHLVLGTENELRLVRRRAAASVVAHRKRQNSTSVPRLRRCSVKVRLACKRRFISFICLVVAFGFGIVKRKCQCKELGLKTNWTA